MSLTNRDRKILWGRAGNRCSYRFRGEVCNEELSSYDNDQIVVHGEECHIVGQQPSAPRYADDFPTREAYDNAVLMCRKHH